MRSRFTEICLVLFVWPASLAQSWSGAQYADWSDSWLFGQTGFEASVYGDPDFDGAHNFVEFGRGTDPLAPDPPSIEHLPPVRNLDGNATEFAFEIIPDLSEVAWNFSLSNDLQNWRRALPEATVAIEPSGNLDRITLSVADRDPIDSALFGRVAWSWRGGTVGATLLSYTFDAGSDLPLAGVSSWISGGSYDTSLIGEISAPGSSSGTLTIGSGGTGGTDVTPDVPVTTWIRNDFPNDDKEDYHLYVGSLAGCWDLRGLLAFDLTAIPDTATITDATVSLWQSGHSTGNNDNEPPQQVELALYSMTAPIDNSETWNSASGLFGSSLATATGDPSVTAAGIVHQFSSAEVANEIGNALVADTMYFGLASPDLEAQTIRQFFVLDGAPASNPSAPGAIGPSLEVRYNDSGNYRCEVPGTATAGTLADALAGDHYHEFAITVAPARADLLTLVFDHFGASTMTDFTSHVAVFASADGFAARPTPADALHTSSVLVTTSQDDREAIETVIAQIGEARFSGTLTIRLYFYDDAVQAGSVTGVDNIRLHGFSPEKELLRYGFAGGLPKPEPSRFPAVAGSEFITVIGGLSVPNEQSYVSSLDTTTNLEGAIAGGHYHQFTATVSDPEVALLALKFDHHGTSASGSFTSNIAVFSSTDGFATDPVPDDAMALSTVTVNATQNARDPIAPVNIPLDFPGFSGALTFRFYFFDDANAQNSYNRIDTVRVCGDALQVVAAATEKIVTDSYAVQIANPGFRMGITTARRAVIPPDPTSGLFFLGSPAASSEKLSMDGNKTTYRVTNGNGQTALAEIATEAHTVEVTVTLENNQTGEIRMRTGSPGAAFGLGDRGGWEPNANLATTQKSYPMMIDAGAYRWSSSFLVFPEPGAAGAFFQKQGGTVSIGPDAYQMTNASASQQKFYYYLGTMEEIYAAWRATRIAEGYPGVTPKMDGFELGFETWDLLRWNTNASTVQDAIQGYLDRDYKICWAVTGSGFWQPQGTTVSFGLYDFTKYPESAAPPPPDLGDWLAGNNIRWMIGQRTNFVKLGGPHSSNPGESGATMFDTSPHSQEGIDLGYFLTTATGDLLERTSPTFPTVPCYLLDGNVPGAAAWFKNHYDSWGADGVKEDTMLATTDHTIYNAPMRLIAESGDLVMARCGAYSSPGTLTRVNDTNGARSMTLRGPINYLQYAASGAPNVYSDTAGFNGMGNVTATLRHSWLLALTAGMAVSDCPWKHGWSAANEAKFKKIVDFHHALGPYLHSCAVDSHTTGYPHTMTPLPIAFPDDPATYNLASSANRQFEWMIGPSLLAAPLLHNNYANSSQLDIYLPTGKWIDFESGQIHHGPTTLSDFNMPLEKTPLFVGGKGVIVRRESDGSLQAVIYPIANGGSSYTFTHPDGTSTSTITNDNDDWNPTTLQVTDPANSSSVPFSADLSTGAISFDLSAGRNYILTGGTK